MWALEVGARVGRADVAAEVGMADAAGGGGGGGGLDWGGFWGGGAAVWRADEGAAWRAGL